MGDKITGIDIELRRKMKKCIFLTILLTATVAYGVTVITYNVPDSFGAKLLAACIAQSDAHVTITIRGSQGASDPNQEDYSAKIDFRTPPHDPNVPNAIFVKRRIALFASAIQAAHQRKLKNDTRNDYIEAAPIVDVNEPDPNEMN